MNTWRNSSFDTTVEKRVLITYYSNKLDWPHVFPCSLGLHGLNASSWSGIPDGRHHLAVVFHSPHVNWFILVGGSKVAVYVPALSTTYAEFAGSIITVAVKVTSDMCGVSLNMIWYMPRYWECLTEHL